jgi:hypothetical protein
MNGCLDRGLAHILLAEFDERQLEFLFATIRITGPLPHVESDQSHSVRAIGIYVSPSTAEPASDVSFGFCPFFLAASIR